MKTSFGWRQRRQAGPKLRQAARLIMLGLLLFCLLASSPDRTAASGLYQELRLVIPVEADAFVRSIDLNNTNTSRINFGKQPELWVQNFAQRDAPFQLSYLRFRISPKIFPPSAVITSAAAQVFFIGPPRAGLINLDVRQAVDQWDEYQITYLNQPPAIDSPFPPLEINSNAPNDWVTFADLTKAAQDWLKNRETVYTFWLRAPLGKDIQALFSSREGANPPRILITYHLPLIITPTSAQVVIPPIVIPPHENPPIENPQPPLDEGCHFLGLTVSCDQAVDYPWLALGAGLLTAAAFFYFIRTARRQSPLITLIPPSPPGEPPDSTPRPSVLPGLPPPRLLRIWLTQITPAGVVLVGDDASLLSEQFYGLNFQIDDRSTRSANSVPVGTITPLELVLFSPETDFRIAQRSAILPIGEAGSSQPLQLAVQPVGTGLRRIRACLYYHNVLLQSALLEASVVEAGQAGAGGAAPANTPEPQGVTPEPQGVSRLLDYAASPDLLRLDLFSRPALSIFTNQAADGTHWIGLYSADANAGENLRSGELFVFEPQHLTYLAESERFSLSEVQGERKYRLDYPLPLEDPSILKLENNLINLAVDGFKLYNDLFLNDPSGLGKKRLWEFARFLNIPGLVSVARCRGQSTSLPWAALYSFFLDIDHPYDIHLCPLFKQDLLANRWNDHTVQTPLQDYLDSPQDCRARPECPLSSPTPGLTVCPFGFWGFMHQIEQPIQQVPPTPVDATPDALLKKNAAQERVLRWNPGEKLRCAVGVNPSFANAAGIDAEIQAILPANVFEVQYSEDSGRILAQIKEGGRQLYYFYCHGIIEDNNFKLGFSPDPISSASLYPFNINWPEQPRPLFILNGCETSATTPELIHGFLEKLRLLGASGVVGTEIPVATDFARPFGSLLIFYLLKGDSIGESFLKLRRHLLRQGNPLGLAYTYYAPADLHLHIEGNCAWCQAHGLAPQPIYQEPSHAGSNDL